MGGLPLAEQRSRYGGRREVGEGTGREEGEETVVGFSIKKIKNNFDYK